VQDHEEANHPGSVCECKHKNSTCVAQHCNGCDETLVDAITKRTSNCHADDLHHR
jgi:hypothetical protein